ncbi:cyclopropane-fatty-acyl-phospholipid synthase [Actinopolyspora lacussalsi subsp. righensis]|uniref:Cyclopropane-fatty-acyl-phospholipid synthase n=1 Tax=Actinopolyspora righensis TaxID=995060 RepID=A0A1I7C6E9_9ACTN|nr:cyclopropane-fatty-acyl-phospholipid synthase [Actinopolyspora righensis]
MLRVRRGSPASFRSAVRGSERRARATPLVLSGRIRKRRRTAGGASGVADGIADLVERVLGVEPPLGISAWDGSGHGPPGNPRVLLRGRRALRHLLYRPGELGLARAFVTGDLDVRGDLTEALRRCRALARHEGVTVPRFGPGHLWGLVRDFAVLGALGPRPDPPRSEARPTGRLHSRRRDSQVIAHHYDLGNEFYGLLLDPRMAYSCGYWPDDGTERTLAAAQEAKLDLICRKLGLDSGTRLLDVGCGWGSLLLYAAQHYGVSATGVTLSTQQADHVRRRAHELGLAELVEVRRCDYRELAVPDSGEYDAVASVEMGEHVGSANYPDFVATLHRMLRPGGRLLLQQMSRGDSAPGGGAFIGSYIAPDMNMVPIGATLWKLERAGFEVRDVQAMREHYVYTVRAWLRTLLDRWDEVIALAGTEQARVWWLYLAGGGLAFEENRMGVHQILGVRPHEDGSIDDCTLALPEVRR